MPEGEAATRGGLRPGGGVPAYCAGRSAWLPHTWPVDLEGVFKLAPLFFFWGGGGHYYTIAAACSGCISIGIKNSAAGTHAPLPVSQGTAVAGIPGFCRQSVCFNQLIC